MWQEIREKIEYPWKHTHADTTHTVPRIPQFDRDYDDGEMGCSHTGQVSVVTRGPVQRFRGQGHGNTFNIYEISQTEYAIRGCFVRWMDG